MDAKMTAFEAAEFKEITVQAIHKKLKTKNLSAFKSQGKTYFGYETARELFDLKFECKIYGFQNLKGGVGKTECTHVTGVRANLYGARVLLIDTDLQGNLTEVLGVDAEERPILIDVIEQGIPIQDTIVNISPGLDLIPSRVENAVLDNILMLKKLPLDRVYKDLFDQLRENYDLILVDCPPALGQSVTATMLAVDEILAPVIPDKRSISGLNLCYQEIETIKKNYKKEVNLRVFLNKFDARNRLSDETLSYLIKHPIYGQLRFKSHIRASQEFPNAVSKGESIFKTLRSTAAKEDIDLFVKELLGLNKDNN